MLSDQQLWKDPTSAHQRSFHPFSTCWQGPPRVITMSTTNLTSSASKKYLIRPVGGPKQVYENVPPDATVGTSRNGSSWQRAFQWKIRSSYMARKSWTVSSSVEYICRWNAKQPTDHRTLESYHIAQVPLLLTLRASLSNCESCLT